MYVTHLKYIKRNNIVKFNILQRMSIIENHSQVFKIEISNLFHKFEINIPLSQTVKSISIIYTPYKIN